MSTQNILTILGALLASSVLAQAQDKPDLRLWKTSAVALVVANVADVHSSRGLRELNPLLRSDAGRFNAGQAIQLKGALIGAAIGTQWLVLRATGGRGRKAFAVVNFIMAGTTAGTAVRNYGLHK